MKSLFWAVFLTTLALTLLLFMPLPATGEAAGLIATSSPAVAADLTEVAQPPAIPPSDAQNEVKAAVAAAFPRTPQMIAVVRCESGFKQFDRTGNPLISPTHDVGVMQVNIKTWGKLAQQLKLDIYHSAADNIAMGVIILKKQGLDAWTCKG